MSDKEQLYQSIKKQTFKAEKICPTPSLEVSSVKSVSRFSVKQMHLVQFKGGKGGKGGDGMTSYTIRASKNMHNSVYLDFPIKKLE